MTSINWVLILVFLGWLLLAFGIGEFLHRILGIKSNYTRKVVHVSAAAISFVMPWHINAWDIGIVAIVSLVTFAITKRNKWLPAIQGVQRITYGEFAFPIGVAIAAFVWLPDNITAFQVGILVMGVSDTLAEIVGQRIPLRLIQIPYGYKSWGGSLTFFISTFVLLMVFLPNASFHQFILVVVSTLLLTLVELVQGRGIDNASLPVMAGWMFTICAC